VIEGDLKSYFDTVHHRKLLSLLKRRLADRLFAPTDPAWEGVT
jgi:RNA-directed DNA polymerase